MVSDIENAALDDLVIVGHSLAGLTVPGVVTKLGSARVREMILATTQVPANGSALVDTFPGAQSWYFRRIAKRKVQKGRSVRFAYCIGEVFIVQRNDSRTAQVRAGSVLSGISPHHDRKS